MMVVDVVREFAYGLRLGARHSLERHAYTEKALRPALTTGQQNAYVGVEQAGR